MKIAAVQMNAEFADVEANMKKAEKFAVQAGEQGAELVLLPELFTSAIGFSPNMLGAAKKDGTVPELMEKLSRQYDIIMGGSYLWFDGDNIYNEFRLTFPDGKVFMHRKDIPTQFENCYYTRGDTDNVFHTPIGDIGIALCWEMIRYDTLKRLSKKADIVLAGSCWWDLPDDAPKERQGLREYNQSLALETPVTFAKLLHVPVIHSGHCGKITAYNFPKADKLQTRQLVGAAQIIDADGNIIARRPFGDGEGMIITDIDFGKTKRREADIENEKYWIPDLPEAYLRAWDEINPLGEEYYKNTALPYCKNM